MSGIAGAVLGDKRPDLIERQAAAIAHRGPDGHDRWASDGVHLLHAHHNTTGFRENNLGLDDAPLRITGDIRLDNRAELGERLELPHLCGLSDTDLVLRSYQRWGRDCCLHLTGDFAFALWDEARQTLFCARDPLGVKPFFYQAGSGSLVFASELAGVTLGQGAIDEARIASFLVGFSDSPAGTVFKHALRLEPGHWLTFAHGQCVTQRYWQASPMPDLSGEAATNAFRRLFGNAVSARLRGSPDIGAMLSGGLDSSSIVGMAASQLGSRRLKTYSFAYPQTPDLDERRYVDAVLDAHTIDPTFVPLDDWAPLQGLDGLAEGDNDLFFGPGLPKMLRVFRTAREAGTQVLLDGHGGDEVVSHGFGRLRELARAGRWLTLHEEARGLGKTFGESPSSIFLHYWSMYGAGRRASNLLRSLRSLLPQPAIASPLAVLSPALAARTDIADRYRNWAQAYGAARATEQDHHIWNVTAPGVAEGFEALDRAASRAGIELRFPFFDADLVGFALGLPSSEILQNGWSRSVLRRAMEGILPPEVQWRRDKTDFSRELRFGLPRHHRQVLLAVAADRDGVGSYVDLPRLDRAIQQALSAPEKLPAGDLFMIWRCILLFFWLKNRGAA
jgi:asparagine synthase (glutamine-hydrolysing)